MMREAPCGLYVHIDLPRNVDSIYVKICSKDSLCTFFRDAKSCKDCLDRDVWIAESNNNLNELFGWKNGEYELYEIAYCNGGKTEFPFISFSIKKGKLNSIDVNYNSVGDYGYSPFIPVDNGCGIDTAYKVRFISNNNCIE